MNQLDTAAWLEEQMSALRPVCAMRLHWMEAWDDARISAGVRLPRTLILDLAPELWHTRQEERWAPVVLKDAVGLATGGELVLHGPKPGATSRAQLWMYDLSGAETPLGNPENAGALAVLAFERSRHRIRCWYLVCQTLAEEDLIEQRLGPVEPDLAVVWGARELLVPAVLPLPAEIPQMILESQW